MVENAKSMHKTAEGMQGAWNMPLHHEEQSSSVHQIEHAAQEDKSGAHHVVLDGMARVLQQLHRVDGRVGSPCAHLVAQALHGPQKHKNRAPTAFAHDMQDNMIHACRDVYLKLLQLLLELLRPQQVCMRRSAKMLLQELASSEQVRGMRDCMCTYLQPLVPSIGILRHAHKRQQVTLHTSALTGQAACCLQGGWQYAPNITTAVPVGRVAMAWKARLFNPHW